MKKKTNPRFKDGDIVLISTMNDGIFTVDGEPTHNGLTWMYAFQGVSMRCGEMYLRLKPEDNTKAGEMLDAPDGKYFIEGSSLFTLHLRPGIPAYKNTPCNKFYFNVQPDYGGGITKEMAEKEAQRIHQILHSHQQMQDENALLKERVKELESNKEDQWIFNENLKDWLRVQEYNGQSFLVVDHIMQNYTLTPKPQK
jgi:hypothetical protein